MLTRMLTTMLTGKLRALRRKTHHDKAETPGKVTMATNTPTTILHTTPVALWCTTVDLAIGLSQLLLGEPTEVPHGSKSVKELGSEFVAAHPLKGVDDLSPPEGVEADLVQRHTVMQPFPRPAAPSHTQPTFERRCFFCIAHPPCVVRCRQERHRGIPTGSPAALR
jgi:hypothetical protein